MRIFSTKNLIRTFYLFIWIGVISFLLNLPNIKFTSSSSSPNTLHIFCWGDIFEPSSLKEFEEETGIKVKLNNYTSNEELMIKLKSSGNRGYDLIVPSDYAVTLLAKEGLLKKIDKSRINFYDKINPLFKALEYDPQHDFSLPFQWEIYGYGIDKEYFKDKPFKPSLEQIFNEKIIDYPIAMVNDPVEAINFAAFYLFGAVESLNIKQLSRVQKLLQKQKNWVEAYVNFRAEYFLATRSCPLAISSSSYIRRIAKDFDFIEFVIPKEYSFITIENFAIPKATENDDLIYTFLNYIYKDRVMARQCDHQFMYPSIPAAYEKMHLDEQQKNILKSLTKDNLYFIRNLISEQKRRQLWVDIKSRN